jgi:hypothetical protein
MDLLLHFPLPIHDEYRKDFSNDTAMEKSGAYVVLQQLTRRQRVRTRSDRAARRIVEDMDLAVRQ